MNYTRRPNRPDGNVYREMRRPKLLKPGTAGVGRRQGAMVSIGAVVVVLLCAGVLAWMHFH
jgi:hypothetical protein